MCRGVYLHGECYAFSIALHRGLGWPIIGLVCDNEVRHALVRNPDDNNLYYDARGKVCEANLQLPLRISPPYELRDIEEQDLYAIRPIQPMSIMRAMRIAQLLWPDMAWLNSVHSHLLAFAKDLEAISRKHGLWIRAAVPGCPPMIAEAGGDEGGYIFKPTDDSITYSLDRYLGSLPTP